MRPARGGEATGVVRSNDVPSSGAQQGGVQLVESVIAEGTSPTNAGRPGGSGEATSFVRPEAMPVIGGQRDSVQLVQSSWDGKQFLS